MCINQSFFLNLGRKGRNEGIILIYSVKPLFEEEREKFIKTWNNSLNFGKPAASTKIVMNLS